MTDELKISLKICLTQSSVKKTEKEMYPDDNTCSVSYTYIKLQMRQFEMAYR